MMIYTAVGRCLHTLIMDMGVTLTWAASNIYILYTPCNIGLNVPYQVAP